MPQLRRDPIIGRWTVIDAKHLMGPGDFKVEDNTPTRAAVCPFCPGRENQTPMEVDALRVGAALANTPGWSVRTIPNKFPVLFKDVDVKKEGIGIYDTMSGAGAHEVVIENPSHDKNMADFSLDEMTAVINQYQSRYLNLSKDKRLKYVLIFKNYGSSAGATVEHPHSQIIGLPMVPKSVLEEIKGAEKYHHDRERCIYCDMIAQEYEDKERLVIENNAFLSFCPFAPRYAFETWVMPKAHSADFGALDAAGKKALAATLKEVLGKMKKVLRNPAYNFYLHTAPIDYALPSAYHWHIEIIPKLTRSVGFEWGTGLHIVPTFPHDAARYLREASA